MKIKKIKKRDGRVVDFDEKRIFRAISKAVKEVEDLVDEVFVQSVCDEVLFELEDEREINNDQIPSVEHIQDLVEKKLAEAGNFEVTKRYILYRAERAKLRAKKRVEALKKIDKNLLKVTKANGRKEFFKKNKLRKTFNRAAKGFKSECKFKEVYDILKLQLVDNITTDDLMKNMRRACLNLISVNNIAWQNIAGRIYTMELYAQACRNRKMKVKDIYSTESFVKHFDTYVKKDLYYHDFYKYYSKQDIVKASKSINKKRDFDYIYSTILSFDKRYLLNPNKKIFELPQEMYLAVGLFLAIPEKKENRLKMALRIYEVCSTQKLSLPTPTLLNARTNYHQLSSCFKFNVDDDLRSIYHVIENLAQISKFGGGAGVYLGHIRAKGAAIRGVEGSSGGIIPWTKVINNTATSVNQLGSRIGAISVTTDIWHKDIFDFLNLQTETGDIRSKAFDIFPAISIPDLFMKRVAKDKNWTLFDPHEVEKVTGKNMEDQFNLAFDKFYRQCEKNKKLKLKEVVSAKDLFKTFMKTAVETGMPYIFFRDTVNRVNPNSHVGNVYATQLCTEICQNTSPSKFIGEKVTKNKVAINYEMGDTVVCNLASINVAKVNTQKEIDEVFPVAMRVLDNVIDLNFYPVKESRETAKRYRPVGLGFMGLAEYLACNQLAYESPKARKAVDELFERYALATLENSRKLAREKGAYPLFKGSQWSKGILFGRKASWYNKKNIQLPTRWKRLIKGIKRDGLRFGYHLAPAPNTSTAGVVGTTAGLMPIYQKFFVETNVIAPTVTVAPNLSKENFWYYKEYKQMKMSAVIDMYATLYKWVDQSIPFEWMIDPAQISPEELYNYYFKAWRKKIKTIYYLRSLSGEMKEDCESCSG